MLEFIFINSINYFYQLPKIPNIMPVLRITQYGEPILREKGEALLAFNEELKSFSRDMIDTLHDEEGAGLAAQQVGKALQMFVVNIGTGGKPVEFDYTYDGRDVPLALIMPMAVCNPTIEAINAEKESTDEGCLSFPGMRLDDISRPYAIRMRFQDLDGASHILECDGFLARCCQHEYDHLQGTLFIDRVPKETLDIHESHLKELERESQEFMKKHRKTEA